MPIITPQISTSSDATKTAEDWKQSVRLASTGPGDLATDFVAGATMDTKTLIVGTRILLKDQADGTENGLRIVQDFGSPLRAGDAQTGKVSSGLMVFVSEGLANGGKYFVLETIDPIILGATLLVFREFEAVSLSSPPIGTIMAWHKDLTGTPSLPLEWVECNGQVLSDPNSPYDGETIPDLNGGARFLRGAATSGAFQAEDLKSHQHHITRDLVGSAGSTVQFAANQGISDFVGADTDLFGGAETRPINMSVVWILRIK